MHDVVPKKDSLVSLSADDEMQQHNGYCVVH